jgi:hypothetical protein
MKRLLYSSSLTAAAALMVLSCGTGVDSDADTTASADTNQTEKPMPSLEPEATLSVDSLSNNTATESDSLSSLEQINSDVQTEVTKVSRAIDQGSQNQEVLDSIKAAKMKLKKKG